MKNKPKIILSVRDGTHKVCPACQKRKTHNEYGKRKGENGNLYLCAYCLPCAAKRTRDFRNKNK